jgi:hypothetical protein
MDFASIWLNILKFLSAENFFFVKNIYFAAPQAAQLAHSLLPRDTSGQHHFIKFILFNELYSCK